MTRAVLLVLLFCSVAFANGDPSTYSQFAAVVIGGANATQYARAFFNQSDRSQRSVREFIAVVKAYQNSGLRTDERDERMNELIRMVEARVGKLPLEPSQKERELIVGLREHLQAGASVNQVINNIDWNSPLAFRENLTLIQMYEGICNKTHLQDWGQCYPVENTTTSLDRAIEERAKLEDQKTEARRSKVAPTAVVTGTFYGILRSLGEATKTGSVISAFVDAFAVPESPTPVIKSSDSPIRFDLESDQNMADEFMVITRNSFQTFSTMNCQDLEYSRGGLEFLNSYLSSKDILGKGIERSRDFAQIEAHFFEMKRNAERLAKEVETETRGATCAYAAHQLKIFLESHTTKAFNFIKNRRLSRSPNPAIEAQYVVENAKIPSLSSLIGAAIDRSKNLTASDNCAANDYPRLNRIIEGHNHSVQEFNFLALGSRGIGSSYQLTPRLGDQYAYQANMDYKMNFPKKLVLGLLGEFIGAAVLVQWGGTVILSATATRLVGPVTGSIFSVAPTIASGTKASYDVMMGDRGKLSYSEKRRLFDELVAPVPTEAKDLFPLIYDIEEKIYLLSHSSRQRNNLAILRAFGSFDNAKAEVTVAVQNFNARMTTRCPLPTGTGNMRTN